MNDASEERIALVVYRRMIVPFAIFGASNACFKGCNPFSRRPGDAHPDNGHKLRIAGATDSRLPWRQLAPNLSGI